MRQRRLRALRARQSRQRACNDGRSSPGPCQMRDTRLMAEWRMSGTYIEFCNCDPGCGCNFRGVPSSPEGNCEAVLTHVIDEGSFDGVDLAGARVSWALWWPGA